MYKYMLCMLVELHLCQPRAIHRESQQRQGSQEACEQPSPATSRPEAICLNSDQNDAQSLLHQTQKNQMKVGYYVSICTFVLVKQVN